MTAPQFPQISFYFIIACLTGFSTSSPSFSATQPSKRSAAVYYSDGSIETGKIALPSGIRFKLNIPEGGTISTTDMITGEDVKYGKIRLFDLAPLRELRFYPVKEEMRRDWKFVGKTKYDSSTGKADYTPAPKEYSGAPYPLRYLNATAEFNSGEMISGHLFSVPLYFEIEPEPGSDDDFLSLSRRRTVKKLLLTSKQRGAKTTSLTDLVYIERIRLLDEGSRFDASLKISVQGQPLPLSYHLQTVTQSTLTPLKTRPDKNHPGHDFIVQAALGEPVYLALQTDRDYWVGWPEENNPELIKLVNNHLQRQRDFYNDKQLLGAISLNNDREILTLVNLRRRHASTNFGKIGGEWDKSVGGIVEPWRLSLWLWKYDKANQELSLSRRGTFFRVIFRPDDPTPIVHTSTALWKMVSSDNNTQVTFNGDDLIQEIKNSSTFPPSHQ